MILSCLFLKLLHISQIIPECNLIELVAVMQLLHFSAGIVHKL